MDEEIPDYSLKDEYRKHLPDKLVRYYDQISSLLEVNDMNIGDKSKLDTSIAHGILTQYYAECNILDKLKTKREELVEQKTEKEKNNSDSEKTIPSPGKAKPAWQVKNEVEKSKEIKDIDKKIKDQSMIVNYLKDSLDIMSRFSFTIKNAVELIKLENG